MIGEEAPFIAKRNLAIGEKRHEHSSFKYIKPVLTLDAPVHSPVKTGPHTGCSGAQPGWMVYTPGVVPTLNTRKLVRPGARPVGPVWVPKSAPDLVAPDLPAPESWAYENDDIFCVWTLILGNLGFLKAKNKIYPIETIKPKKEKEIKYQIIRGVNLP
jgi:hypothetical protein